MNLCFVQVSHTVNGNFYHALTHSRWVAPIHIAVSTLWVFAFAVCLQLCPTMMQSKDILNLAYFL